MLCWHAAAGGGGWSVAVKQAALALHSTARSRAKGEGSGCCCDNGKGLDVTSHCIYTTLNCWPGWRSCSHNK